MTFTTKVNGVGENFTYQWQHNGENMSGETQDTLNLNNITKKEGGSYQCIVKNEFGDSHVCSAELVVTSKNASGLHHHTLLHSSMDDGGVGMNHETKLASNHQQKSFIGI